MALDDSASLSACPQESQSRCEVRPAAGLLRVSLLRLCLSFLIRNTGMNTQPRSPALCLPQTSSTVSSPHPLPDFGFLGHHICREGYRHTSSARTGPSRSQPGQPARRSSSLLHGPPLADPSGGPHAEQMAGEVHGPISCCYLLLMTRSVNFAGNTPSCLCVPPALITVIEL